MTQTVLESRCKCLAGVLRHPSVAVPRAGPGRAAEPRVTSSTGRHPPALLPPARVVLPRGEKNAFKNPEEKSILKLCKLSEGMGYYITRNYL